ncbi:MAG TPA: preprotein translocase subunit YajC [Actinocrinis sp.]|nr:preprotein translocase subunit YajC [Actinocrinis sp.]
MQLLLLYIVVIGGVFIFMTSRGNKKRQAQASQMQSALVVGAEVRTIGGMVGEVVEVTDEHVLIETTPGVRLKFVKSAVAGVVAPSEAEPLAGEESEDEAEPEDHVEGDSEHESAATETTEDEDSAESVETPEPAKR